MSTIKVTAAVKRQIGLYRQFMLDHEYTVETSLGYSTHLSRFLRWPSLDKANHLQKSITAFLEAEYIAKPKAYRYCRAALYLYFKMIEGRAFPKRDQKECNPHIEAIVNRFYDFSVNIKHIKSSTAMVETKYVRSFLEFLDYVELIDLEGITAIDIRDFVLNHLSHLSDSSKGLQITTIRNFFRFLKFEGTQVHESIFLLPLSAAVWKKSAFPKTMDIAIFDRLSEIPNAKTPTGKRDRCIILCFTELALRCTETAKLTLDDFNWHEGTVSIKDTKTRSERKLPVSKKLGQAVTEYLINVRPQTTSRVLFVRFKHHCGEPMGCMQIRGVVRRVYAKTGVDEKATSTGTHILRRTAGTKIYNAGNSLKVTADILGHISLDSTAHYAKADIEGLRSAASPWPATRKAGE